MSFNFNFDDDDNPFGDISDMLQHLQKHLLDQLRQQGIDPDELMRQMADYMAKNPGAQSFGFSISMGPDGKADFQPINGSPVANQVPRQSQFEEPFLDIFFDEASRTYQIIAEIQGIEDENMVIIDFDQGNDFQLHAETGPFKYKVSRLLKHEVDPDTMSLQLNNGTLEIYVKAK